MKDNLANIRQEYKKGRISRCNLPANPIELFEKWLNEAMEAQVNEPTAVIVGTVSPDGKPATRTVLLKGLQEGKFIFYTNYESRKGEHMRQNPHVSLSFVWHGLERQVHIEGSVSKTSAAESDAYFRLRPYNSRIGARISPQSRPIPSRVSLIKSFLAEASRYVGKEIPRPENWGGYEVTPGRIEFWQGRPSRLHDRMLYTLQPTGEWKIERLAP